jgi:peptidoglycan/xylan/chitin deacetylase (PgdA/CDA1 family)
MRKAIQAVVLVLLAAGTARPDTVLIFRYDDYAAAHPGESGEGNARRLATDAAVINVFRKHHLRLTMGVIPFSAGEQPANGLLVTATPSNLGGWLIPLPGDHERMRLLQRAIAEGIVDPALHGYSHELLVSGPHRSEFAGLDRAVQEYRVRQGKKLLEQWLRCSIITFIPPFNGYDETTLQVLAENGFHIISANQRGLTCVRGLLYLPQNIDTIGDARKAVLRTRNRDSLTVLVLTLHHYTFTGDLTKNIGELDTFLSELDGYSNVKVLSLGQFLAEHSSQSGMASSWLSPVQRMYPLIDTLSRLAERSPILILLLGVGIPIILNHIVFRGTKLVGSQRSLHSLHLPSLRLYTCTAITITVALLAMGYWLYKHYDPQEVNTKMQLFLLFCAAFATETIRRLFVEAKHSRAAG